MRDVPEGDLGGESDHLIAWLRFYRATVVTKCASLPVPQLSVSRVASGWTPLGLLVHLAALERRWVEWGFLGLSVAEPYPDGESGPWRVPPGRTLDLAVADLRSAARLTDETLTATTLDTPGSRSGRFGVEPGFTARPAAPTLRWIGLHLLQEYARHTGQLDVVVELQGGLVGE